MLRGYILRCSVPRLRTRTRSSSGWAAGAFQAGCWSNQAVASGSSSGIHSIRRSKTARHKTKRASRMISSGRDSWMDRGGAGLGGTGGRVASGIAQGFASCPRRFPPWFDPHFLSLGGGAAGAVGGRPGPAAREVRLREATDREAGVGKRLGGVAVAVDDAFDALDGDGGGRISTLRTGGEGDRIAKRSGNFAIGKSKRCDRFVTGRWSPAIFPPHPPSKYRP